MKETEKPFYTEFNQSKARINDNGSKLSASDPHESDKLDIGQWANFVTASEQKAKKQSNIYKIYVKIEDIWHCFEYLTTKKWRAQNMTLEVPN